MLVPAARSEVSGLTVSATGDGLSVFVDGKNLGSPPVSLKDVEPGTHTVRVAGADGAYEAYEQTVKVETGEIRSLGPIRLHLLKGRLHLTAGDGASEGVPGEIDQVTVAATSPSDFVPIDLPPDTGWPLDQPAMSISREGRCNRSPPAS